MLNIKNYKREWNHREKQIRRKKLLEKINDLFVFFRQLRIFELVWVKLSVNNSSRRDEHVAFIYAHIESVSKQQ